jgi:hypothetical protein
VRQSGNEFLFKRFTRGHSGYGPPCAQDRGPEEATCDNWTDAWY